MNSSRTKNKFLIQSAKTLFQPCNLSPKDVKGVRKEPLPKSQRLMLDFGIMKQSSNGLFSILPIGLRALNKLKALIDYHMAQLGAQEVQLPMMTDANLWKSSGRWNSTGLDLMKLKDKHGKDYLLGPTHEESFANLFSSFALSYQEFPYLLYQMTMKFRDEIKPRCGLLKTREFLMKDLYSFDINLDNASNTYHKVCEKYVDIFQDIGLPVYKVLAKTEDMGGDISHEYLMPSDIGEDVFFVCESCYSAQSSQISTSLLCESCGKQTKRKIKGIEVAHTFLLGTKYSKALNATFKGSDNKENYLFMGSYGIGLTRILAASIEVLSLEDQIRWPSAFVPFTIVIITPKDGSKDSENGKRLGIELYESLSSYPHLIGNILLDDRSHFTIGKRIVYAKKIGYPFLVIVGEEARKDPPMIELQCLSNKQTKHLSIKELMNFFATDVLAGRTCRSSIIM